MCGPLYFMADAAGKVKEVVHPAPRFSLSRRVLFTIVTALVSSVALTKGRRLQLKQQAFVFSQSGGCSSEIRAQ